MEKDLTKKDESTSASLINLLKQYTSRVNQRETIWNEGTRACREQQKGLENSLYKLRFDLTFFSSNQ